MRLNIQLKYNGRHIDLFLHFWGIAKAVGVQYIIINTRRAKSRRRVGILHVYKIPFFCYFRREFPVLCVFFFWGGRGWPGGGCIVSDLVGEYGFPFLVIDAGILWFCVFFLVIYAFVGLSIWVGVFFFGVPFLLLLLLCLLLRREYVVAVVVSSKSSEIWQYPARKDV